MNKAPKSIEYHKKSALLELHYDGAESFKLSAEYLRVRSPSAEVQGHHPSQAVLQSGKRDVKISSISPVGNYAIQIHFDDDHSSGIYSWELLWDLHLNRERYWQEYLDQLVEAGKFRDPEQQAIKLFDPKSH